MYRTAKERARKEDFAGTIHTRKQKINFVLSDLGKAKISQEEANLKIARIIRSKDEGRGYVVVWGKKVANSSLVDSGYFRLKSTTNPEYAQNMSNSHPASGDYKIIRAYRTKYRLRLLHLLKQELTTKGFVNENGWWRVSNKDIEQCLETARNILRRELDKF